MIGQVTLGTNDLEKSYACYDALLGTMCAARFLENEQFIAWETTPRQPGLSVTKPIDGQEATLGNGVMVALMMDSNEKVDAFYQKAIELGATC